MLVIGAYSLVKHKNSREDMEKHFSYLTKIYPIKNVEDLFEKFPHVANIISTISIKYYKNSYSKMKKYHLTVDANKKRILGTVVNVLIDKEDNILYEEDVEYEKGKIKYINNPNRKDEQIDFLCEHFNYNAVQKYDVLSTHFEKQFPTYAMAYKNPIDYIIDIDKA